MQGGTLEQIHDVFAACVALLVSWKRSDYMKHNTILKLGLFVAMDECGQCTAGSDAERILGKLIEFVQTIKVEPEECVEFPSLILVRRRRRLGVNNDKKRKSIQTLLLLAGWAASLSMSAMPGRAESSLRWRVVKRSILASETRSSCSGHSRSSATHARMLMGDRL